ncbi:GSCOCG00009213001-RA-CDS [Cotesia congregata]|nr:GSCOCG00009213001-RA-CDS [Cotesia congregata]
MKLFIILLMMNIYLAKSSENQVLIHGPETPVYKCKFLNASVKVETFKHKLPRRTAIYSSYKAIHPKLVLVVDYNDYIRDGEKKSLERAVIIIENINSNYQEVNSNSRVEAQLAGVVLITDPDVYSPPKTLMPPEEGTGSIVRSEFYNPKTASLINRTLPPWENYTLADKELERFNDWWKIHSQLFEGLDYDAFIYSFPWYLAGESIIKEDIIILWSFSNGKICKSKPGAIVSSLFKDSHYSYALEVSYFLGVTAENDSKNSHWYTWHVTQNYFDKILLWRNHTAGIVEDNDQRERYTCLRWRRRKEDYDDDLY